MIIIDVLKIIAPFLFLLIIAGAGVFFVGHASNITEGIKVVINWFISKPPVQNIAYDLDDSQFNNLTDKLKQHFKTIVLCSAETDNDLMKVVYRIVGSLDVPADILEIETRRFLRKYFNESAHSAIHIFVYLENDHLTIFCGLSDKGKKYVQEQKNNRRSRELEILEDSDLYD